MSVYLQYKHIGRQRWQGKFVDPDIDLDNNLDSGCGSGSPVNPGHKHHFMLGFKITTGLCCGTAIELRLVLWCSCRLSLVLRCCRWLRLVLWCSHKLSLMLWCTCRLRLMLRCCHRLRLVLWCSCRLRFGHWSSCGTGIMPGPWFPRAGPVRRDKRKLTCCLWSRFC